MNEKTTVTVVAQNGHTKTFKGDVALVFTVDRLKEHMAGKEKGLTANSAYIGHEIPDAIFANTISSLISDLIENDCEGDLMKASCTIFTIAEMLREKSDELAKKATPEQMNTFVNDSLHELLKAILKD